MYDNAFNEWAWKVAQLATDKGIELQSLGEEMQREANEAFERGDSPEEFMKYITAAQDYDW